MTTSTKIIQDVINALNASVHMPEIKRIVTTVEYFDTYLENTILGAESKKLK